MRVEKNLPIRGAWRRLYGGELRTNMLQRAFSPENMQRGLVYGAHGPAESGKTSAVFAVADHWGLQLLVAEDSTNEEFTPPSMGQIILIDPVTAFHRVDVEKAIDFYQGKNSIILVGRNEEEFAEFHPDILVALRYPSATGIRDYVQKILERYEHEMDENDIVAIGDALEGLSYPQVNSIVVDAVLARLALGEPIEQVAFVDAIATFKIIQDRYAPLRQS